MKPVVMGTFRIGIQTLRDNPLRTLLSTLGVIIGVAALVAVLSIGDSLEQFSRDQISQTTDLKTIQVAPRTSERVNGISVDRREILWIQADSLASIRRALGLEASMHLTVQRSEWIHLADDSLNHAARIIGEVPFSSRSRTAEIAAGRMLTSSDLEDDSVAVVTISAATGFGFDPADRILHKHITVGSRQYRVVGVVKGTGIPTVLFPLNVANRAWMETATSPALLTVTTDHVEDVEEARTRIENWIKTRYGDPAQGFRVSSSVQRASQAARAMLIFKLAMGSIAGISLLVGGIGIMNILLASVTERTREIGIRRATGARRGHIRNQFLSESIAISFFGTMIGVLLGLGGAYVVTRLISYLSEAPLTLTFAWSSILAAAVIALLIGLIFGTYPARRAARIQPVDAIRHE